MNIFILNDKRFELIPDVFDAFYPAETITVKQLSSDEMKVKLLDFANNNYEYDKLIQLLNKALDTPVFNVEFFCFLEFDTLDKKDMMFMFADYDEDCTAIACTPTEEFFSWVICGDDDESNLKSGPTDDDYIKENPEYVIFPDDEDYELYKQPDDDDFTANNWYSRDVADNPAVSLIQLLRDVFNDENIMPWGMVTGVRPLKYVDTKKTAEQSIIKLMDTNGLCETKATMLSVVAFNQADYFPVPENSISLYVSIPFCPSRCSYCSFVSHSVTKMGQLIEPYVKLLCEEIKLVSLKMKSKIDTIYIGGGTPTVLTGEQLDTILYTLHSYFNLSNLREFTVEAGRPETITKEKLHIMQSHNVSRISINPQTFNDEVLEKIGRGHTVEDFRNAYEIARDMFDINVDLIAGLPGDTRSSFRNSVENVIALEPENITIHALCHKRGSNLEKNLISLERSFSTDFMDNIYQLLEDNDYCGYYLYKLKNTISNGENIGFMKDDPCLYNIYSMDDSQPIIGLGAGAGTKIITPDGEIIRVFNYKYPHEYTKLFDQMIAKKEFINEY